MSATARTRLEQRLAAAQAHYSGQYSLAARNLRTGEEILVDEKRSYPTASTLKVPVMVEVFRQVDAGTIDLGERIALAESDITRGSGVLQDLDFGIAPTVHDLAMLMIIISDNTATNMLIDRVGGPARVTETMREMGYPSIEVVNKIDFELMDGDNRKLAVASPWDLMRLEEAIVTGTAASAESCAKMLHIMSRQHYLGQAPRYFAYNPYAEPEEKVMTIHSKTGSLRGMRADTGVYRLTDGTDIAFAVMNEGCSDPGFGSEYEGDIINGVVGWCVLDYFWPEQLGSTPGGKSPYLDAALGSTR